MSLYNIVTIVIDLNVHLQSVSFNSEMTEFTVAGNNISEVETLVREIVYVNSRQFPTPGRRNVDISTSIR